MTGGVGIRQRSIHVRVILALLFAAALGGAAAETGRRLGDIALWWLGPAERRDWLLYGPYAETISLADSHLSPEASALLISDGDPALIPYYLHPRKIYQLDVDPETNRRFMNLPPQPHPRRQPESFAVDWTIRLRDEGGALVVELQEAGRK